MFFVFLFFFWGGVGQPDTYVRYFKTCVHKDYTLGILGILHIGSKYKLIFIYLSTWVQGSISRTDLSLFLGLNLTQRDNWLSLSLLVKSAPGDRLKLSHLSLCIRFKPQKRLKSVHEICPGLP